MNGVNTQCLNSGQQYRSQDDDCGAGIHNHTQNQEDNNQNTQHAEAAVEVVQDEILNNGGSLRQGQYTTECGCECQYECQTAVSLNRSNQQTPDLLVVNTLVAPQGYDQSLEYRDTSCLGRSEPTGVDTTQNDDRAQQSQ